MLFTFEILERARNHCRMLPKLKACSHEPGTMNCHGASVTLRLHDDLLSRALKNSCEQLQASDRAPGHS